MKIETNQELFFDKNALAKRKSEINRTSFFSLYANQDFIEAVEWLSDKNSVIDYGCGLGEMLEIYLSNISNCNNKIIGVDISQNCINAMRNKFPNYTFERITDNKLSFLRDSSVESAYIVQVLHHTEDHAHIIMELFRVLDKGGKLYLSDITSNNIFVEFGRKAFLYMPKFIQHKFTNDLVVDDTIPEKLIVDVDKTIDCLNHIGFTIKKISYMHLFLFLFGWMETIGVVGNGKLWRFILKKLLKVEKYMLNNSFFRKRATLFSIYAEKI